MTQRLSASSEVPLLPLNNDRPLTVGESIRASRVIEVAAGRKRIKAALRPRTTGGFARSRGPLALVLFVASRDDRLIRQGFTGFAVLERPLTPPAPPHWAGLAHAVADRVDRNWSTFVLAAPPFVAFLCAAALLPFSSIRLLAVVPVLLAMLHVTVFLCASLLLPLLRRRSGSPSGDRLSFLSSTHWTMTLFHQGNDARIDELFGRVRDRLRHLVFSGVQTIGSQEGTEIDEARLTGFLVLRHDGVTTKTARDRIAAAHPDATWNDGADFSMSGFDSHPDDAERVPAPPLAFLKFYAFSNIGVLLGLAQLLAWQERASCAARPCSGAPTDYGDALAWTAYQLIWRQAPGVEPVSGFAVVLGWLLTALLPLFLLVTVTAVVRRHKYLAPLQKLTRSPVKTRLLIVTVTPTERDAVLDAFEDYTKEVAEPDFTNKVPVFNLGQIAETEVFLVQAATAGGTAAASVPMVAGEAIKKLKPHCAIISGICIGLKPKEQNPGDILVSATIRDLDHAKLLEDETGEVIRIDRGEKVAPSPALHLAAQAAQRRWQRETEVPVHFGEMLSWNKLVDSKSTIDNTRLRYPDAIGEDMEGIGFYATVRWARVEGILIKAVCDRGYDKTDEYQKMAADNAARFALHLVKVGGLAGAHKA